MTDDTPMPPANLTLVCQAVSTEDPYGGLFSVDVSSDVNITELRNAVKKAIAPNLDDVPTDKLVLWKLLTPVTPGNTRDEAIAYSQRIREIVFVDPNSDEAMQENQTIQYLHPNEKLSTYWQEDPGEAHVHLIVQILPTIEGFEEGGIAKRRRVSEDEEEYIRTTALSEFIEAREQDMKAAMLALDPFIAALPNNFGEEQIKLPVLNGFPYDKTGPPIGLFHPVFNSFQAAINSKERIDINESTYNAIQSLIDACSTIFGSRSERNLSFIDHIYALIDRDLIREDESVVLLVAQDEFRSEGVDPYNCASLLYRKHWANPIRRPISNTSYCPTIIITLGGPWICIAGGIYLEKAVIQPLTDNIWLGGGSLTNERLASIARLFAALKSSILTLEAYYHPLKYENPTSKNLTPDGFPFIRGYESTKFTYLSRLPSLNLQDYIYKAKLNDTQDLVIVKFTRTYNPKAHRILADQGLAPRLHYVSPKDTLYEERYLVVMDLVDGESPGSTLTQPIFEQVSEAVRILHSNDLVLGNLRSNNLLVTSKGTAMVTNFEWCGEAGKALYPLVIDEDLHWPEGAGPQRVMEMKYDLVMLDRLNPARS